MIKPPGKPGVAIYFSSKTTKKRTAMDIMVAFSGPTEAADHGPWHSALGPAPSSSSEAARTAHAASLEKEDQSKTGLGALLGWSQKGKPKGKPPALQGSPQKMRDPNATKSGFFCWKFVLRLTCQLRVLFCFLTISGHFCWSGQQSMWTMRAHNLRPLNARNRLS